MLRKAVALSADAPKLHLCSGVAKRKKLMLVMCI